MSYYEACEKIRVNFWTEGFDSNALCPYASQGNQWVGYDNIRSISLKAQYAKNLGLGGIMFWALDLDDFTGNFCGQG